MVEVCACVCFVYKAWFNFMQLSVFILCFANEIMLQQTQNLCYAQIVPYYVKLYWTDSHYQTSVKAEPIVYRNIYWNNYSYKCIHSHTLIFPISNHQEGLREAPSQQQWACLAFRSQTLNITKKNQGLEKWLILELESIR